MKIEYKIVISKVIIQKAFGRQKNGVTGGCMLLFSFSFSWVIKPNQVIVNIVSKQLPSNKVLYMSKISRAEKLDIYKTNPCNILNKSLYLSNFWKIILFCFNLCGLGKITGIRVHRVASQRRPQHSSPYIRIRYDIGKKQGEVFHR